MCHTLRPVTLDGENGTLTSFRALIGVNESVAGNKNNSFLYFSEDRRIMPGF